MFVQGGLRGRSGELEDSDHEEKEKATVYHVLLAKISSLVVSKADLQQLGLHNGFANM